MQQETTAGTPFPEGKEVATLAGGCFWCTEAVFQDLKGVQKVVSGYSGGRRPNPTYEQVCSGATGHAEAIQVTFDPSVISYADLLRVFLTTHDPTTRDRQGADVGTQYRSAIFYHNAEQEKIARQVIQEIEAEHLWDNPIVTEVSAFKDFYPAEQYHQEFFARNPSQPYCQFVIVPKLAKVRQKWAEKLRR